MDRCDFYSDEEYEYAVQMEIEEYREQEYREQLAYEEAFKQYCLEEYQKEELGIIKTFEIQLGVKSEVLKDIENYESPKIILVKSENNLSIKNVEESLEYTMNMFDCDCAYGINLLSKEELNDNKDYYDKLYTCRL